MSKQAKVTPGSAASAAAVPCAPRADYTPRTPLGQCLWELRGRIIASSEKLLNREEIEREVAERRGGQASPSE